MEKIEFSHVAGIIARNVKNMFLTNIAMLCFSLYAAFVFTSAGGGMTQIMEALSLLPVSLIAVLLGANIFIVTAKFFGLGRWSSIVEGHLAHISWAFVVGGGHSQDEDE